MRKDVTTLVLDFMKLEAEISSAILEILDEYLELNEKDKKSVGYGVDGLKQVVSLLGDIKKNTAKRQKKKPKKEDDNIAYV